MYSLSHVLQVPIILVVNGYLGVWHRGEAMRGPPPPPHDTSSAREVMAAAAEADSRWYPLCVHVLGTVLIIIQPLFDPMSGLIFELRDNSLPWNKPVNVSPFSGDLLHHGVGMFLTSLTGFSCVIAAAVWALHRRSQESAAASCEGGNQPLVGVNGDGHGKTEGYGSSA